VASVAADKTREAGTRRRVLLLIPHDPAIDPRIGWMAAKLADEYEVCEIGIHGNSAGCNAPSLEQISENRHRVRVGRGQHGFGWVSLPGGVGELTSTALPTLSTLFVYARLPDQALRAILRARDADAAALSRFRALCEYFVDTNGVLIEAARLTGPFDLVIAADLEALPAALVLGDWNRAAAVYDAHEYWPFSYHDFQQWEIEFWARLERSLVKEAEIRVTVSPHLAAQLSADYDCEFMAVPNCAPAGACRANLRRSHSSAGHSEPVLFLYQGVFAPGRGLELLIRAWQRVEGHAYLLLRGPDNAYKADMVTLAGSLGLKGRKVFFPESVGEDELIAAAAEADVGVIPYEPINVNNRFSCPNKLSQYLAAGLPIISNELAYIKEVVLSEKIGVVVDFRDTEALTRVIDRLSVREAIAEMSRRAQSFFRREFHWEEASAPLCREIEEALGRRPVNAGKPLDFSWIEAGGALREPASDRLTEELDRLNREYPAEITFLNAKIDELTRDSIRSKAKRWLTAHAPGVLRLLQHRRAGS
jgi:glycosyltransferase involved in cell wall biosynthesis